MVSQANFLDILILLGALQGFITAALLIFSKRGSVSKKLLAWLIFFISLACLNMFLLNTDLINESPILKIVSVVLPLIIIMPVGPLMYFYVKSLLNPGFRLEKKDGIHFYPALLDLVPYLTAATYFVGVAIGFVEPNQYLKWAGFIDWFHMYFDIPRWASISCYLWVAIHLLKSAAPNVKNQKFARWAKQFVVGFAVFQVLWLIYLIPYVIPITSDLLLNLVGWYPVYIPLTALVYWLGVNGYFLNPLNTNYLNSNATMDPLVKENTINALTKAMETDRLYLMPDLNLQQVVNHTGINQKTISFVLNQYQGQSFNEFVNGYRVREVQMRLTDPKYDHLTIIGIAYECGFNSQATFQRVFKSLTNQSPKVYRKNMYQNGI